MQDVASNLRIPAHVNNLDLGNQTHREAITFSAITAFVRLMGIYKIANKDAMALHGGMSQSKYTEIVKKVENKDKSITALSFDALTRISYMLGIVKSLRITYGKDVADKWFTRPNRNRIFAQRRPLEYCLEHGINGLNTVRAFLDAQRGYMS
ncbi:MAG: DUF2384 domain-containing protein [Kordiimonadaceae bacterium]|nr:DUF2384 domain-containing protein [Kordiimonadaceae bacterium]